MKYFNPFEEIKKHGSSLPHWQQPGATYFLTFRLADSLPVEVLKKWQQEKEGWMAEHPLPWSAETEAEYHRVFSMQIERWLDAGHGSCLLRQRESRRLVEAALSHFEGLRHVHLSWVIMPNHVHVLTVLHPEWTLEKILHAWKRHSALEINRLLGRVGQLWQYNYFDRLIRNERHLVKVIQYLRSNPAQAKLPPEDYTLWESSFAQSIN